MSLIKTIKVSFNGHDGNKLDGRLELPDKMTPGHIKSYVIFCNCFTCTKNTITTYNLCRELAKNGYAVLRFDFAGLGDSDGKFSESSFTSYVKDILAAYEFMRDNHGTPELLIGHSLGGTSVLEASTRLPQIRAVVTIASPSQPNHILHHFGDALNELKNGRSARINVAGTDYSVDPGFVYDLEKYDMKKSLAGFDKPLLIFSIENDDIVDAINSEELHQWTGTQSKIITVKGSDHLLSSKDDIKKVGRDIIRWYEGVTKK